MTRYLQAGEEGETNYAATTGTLGRSSKGGGAGLDMMAEMERRLRERRMKAEGGVSISVVYF